MAVVLALAAAVLFGAADFAGGLATRRGTALTVVFLSQATGFVVLAGLLAVLPAASPAPVDLAWGASAGVTGGVGVALLYRALAVGTMAVVAPTTAVCAAAIPVLAALLLGERPGPWALAGMGLAALAIVLVSQERRARRADAPARRLPPGVGTAIASGVAIGLFFLSLARTHAGAGLWPLVVARLLSSTLFAALALSRRRSPKLPPRVLALTVGCGVLDMLANALYLLATRGGPLSIVVTLSSLYPASTVLLARVVLRERLNAWQIAGVVSAFVAGVLIVRGG